MKYFLIGIGVILLILLSVWWKYSFALPIFCTTHGCVTTSDWEKETRYQTAFAQASQSSSPSQESILTTIVRRHLIRNRSNITIGEEEAAKYRTSILHATDESAVQRIGFSSFQEYDQAVTMPFLMQEAYMNTHTLKNIQDVYANLSKEGVVLSLLFHYTWDSSKGEVISR